MKAGWEVKALGDFTNVVTKGTTPTSVGFKFVDTGVNFVKIEAISLDGEINTEKLAKISPEAHDALGRSQLQEGDVLFSIAGALGRIAIVEKSILPANTNQALSIIRLNKEARIDREYLAYCLASSAMTEQIEQQKGGVAQQNLSLAQVKGFQIPIPPLDEQKRIVAVLDAAFEGLTRAKENAETNLQNARELFESFRQEIFFPEIRKFPSSRLGECCEFSNGKAHERVIAEDGDFILVNSKFVSTDGQKFKRTNANLFPLVIGDIAMVMSDVPNGRTLAKCFLINQDDTYSLNQRICKVTSSFFDPEFLYFQLNRNPFFLSFDNKENQTNLRKGTILDCPLHIPPMADQVEWSLRLAELRAECRSLEVECSVKLTDIADLRQSLLQKAFAGELT